MELMLAACEVAVFKPYTTRQFDGKERRVESRRQLHALCDQFGFWSPKQSGLGR